MFQEFFFDRVFIEPGDGAQPPGDGSPGPAPGLQLPGEAFNTGPADGEQGQRPGTASGGELAQVKCVRLACQAAVAGQEPGEGEPFGVGEDGLDRGERSSGDGSGHRGTSRPGWNPEGLGRLRVPAIERNLNVSHVSQSQHVTTRPGSRR